MAVSGTITVSSSGTPVPGPSDQPGEVFLLKAHPTNTDTVWIGPKTSGFPLDPGESALRFCRDLSGLTFDADVSGEKICWLLVR